MTVKEKFRPSLLGKNGLTPPRNISRFIHETEKSRIYKIMRPNNNAFSFPSDSFIAVNFFYVKHNKTIFFLLDQPEIYKLFNDVINLKTVHLYNTSRDFDDLNTKCQLLPKITLFVNKNWFVWKKLKISTQYEKEYIYKIIIHIQ